MANEAVFKYLHNQNRPYSANDIVQNLHKEFGKTAVQKALDQLTQDSRILEKTYSKQKVYCVKQEADQNTEEAQKDMQDMSKEISELQEQLVGLKEQIKNSEFELKNLLNSMTTEEAKIEQENLEEQLEKLRFKLKQLSENTVVISLEDKERIENEHTKNLKEYRKRKRICMEIVNTVLEGYPKKKKDLYEETGVEIDEEAGYAPPN